MTVYQCLEGGVIAVLQSYVDEDVCEDRCHSLNYSSHAKHLVFLWRKFANSMCFVHQKDESFYTVSWACNVDGTPFIVAGGLNGIIRVIDAGSEKIHKVSCSQQFWAIIFVVVILLK